jgi:hypothetical protein
MAWHFGHQVALGITVAALAGGCGGAPSSPNREMATLDAPD